MRIQEKSRFQVFFLLSKIQKINYQKSKFKNIDLLKKSISRDPSRASEVEFFMKEFGNFSFFIKSWKNPKCDFVETQLRNFFCCNNMNALEKSTSRDPRIASGVEFFMKEFENSVLFHKNPGKIRNSILSKLNSGISLVAKI